MDFVLEFQCPSCGGTPRYCRICGERCCPCYHDDDDQEPTMTVAHHPEEPGDSLFVGGKAGA